MTPIALREDYGSASVRRLASSCDNADQARRLLSIAAVYDGMSRTNAARVGGMDRQTLRDWIHRFNEDGPAGLVNRKAPGAPARLTAAQLMELAALVEAGPDLVGNGVERWRCLDLMRWIEANTGLPIASARCRGCCTNWASRMSAPGPAMPGKWPKCWRILKKLPTYAGGGHRPLAIRHAD